MKIHILFLIVSFFRGALCTTDLFGPIGIIGIGVPETTELIAVQVKTLDVANAETTGNIEAEICQGSYCCTITFGPLARGASNMYIDTDLADCMEWTLLQDDVAANFSSDSTDGWDGDYMKLLFSNGIQYVCAIGDEVDLPTHPYYVSQCSEGTVSLKPLDRSE